MFIVNTYKQTYDVVCVYCKYAQTSALCSTFSSFLQKLHIKKGTVPNMFIVIVCHHVNIKHLIILQLVYCKQINIINNFISIAKQIKNTCRVYCKYR